MENYLIQGGIACHVAVWGSHQCARRTISRHCVEGRGATLPNECGQCVKVRVVPNFRSLPPSGSREGFVENSIVKKSKFCIQIQTE